MQIAKMFGSLGFKVDETGLRQFKEGIKSARAEMTNLGRGGAQTKKNFRNLNTVLDTTAKKLKAIKASSANKGLGKTYATLAASLRNVDTSLKEIVERRKQVTRALGKIHASVKAGTPIWQEYRRNVVQARRSLINVNNEIRRLRSNARIDVNVNRRTSGGGGSGGFGGGGLGAGMAAGFGMKGFLSHMIPTMALAGGGGMTGFAVTQGVQAAREQTKMESMLLMTATDRAEFKDTVDFVKSEALRLGLSSAELGKSFAQINMSARTMSMAEKKDMFTGFSEFMMAMGTSKDDQKGIFRAINQMFSNGRILQEEINQLSERGIPATLVYDAAMKAYQKDSIQEIKKLQEDGKLDPERVLKMMSGMLQNKARDTGALEKMQSSSIFAQNQFLENLRQTSKEIMDSGLDEMLGQLFYKLSELVTLLGQFWDLATRAAEGFRMMKDAVQENAWAQGILSTALVLLFFRFGKLGKGVKLATRVYSRHKDVLKALAGFMTGTFGKSIGKMIFRLSGWGTAIWLVTEAVQFLYKELDRMDKGQWSFFDELAFNFQEVALRAEIAGLQMRNDWMNTKNLMSMGWDDVLYGGRQTIAVMRGGKYIYDMNRAGITPLNPQSLPQLAQPNNMLDMLNRINNRGQAGSGVLKNPSQLNATINISMPNGDVVRQSQLVGIMP